MLSNPILLIAVLLSVGVYRALVHQPWLELRFVYGLLMVPTLLVLERLALRSGVSVRTLGMALSAYVLFELLVLPLGLYSRIPLLNRGEHFAAFLILSAFATTGLEMLQRGPPTGLQRLGIALFLSGVGLANEVVEYCFRWGTVFFNEDTLLDLTMNTLAVTSYQIVGSWRIRVPRRRAARSPTEP